MIRWKVLKETSKLSANVNRHLHSSRLYVSYPPRKSYSANLTPLQVFWNRRVPINFKYFSLIGASAWGLTHIHPNIIVTLGPPIALGAWYSYKKWIAKQRKVEIGKIIPRSKSEITLQGDKVEILVYDESDIFNVLHNLENQYDHFKIQVIDLIERRIIDYITLNNDESAQNFSLLIDENNQFCFNLEPNDIETFILTKVPFPKFEDDGRVLPSSNDNLDMVDYIKLSLPVFTSKDVSSRKRVGTIEAYMLEIPCESPRDYSEYSMLIKFTPFASFRRSSGAFEVRNIRDRGVYQSQLLKEVRLRTKGGTKEDPEHEITVNI